MSISQLLEECKAQPLNLDEISSFDKEALLLFTNEDVFDDPYIAFSFDHDISIAKLTYTGLKEKIPSATFTSFLLWCAAKSLCENRQANFRLVQGQWYELFNPPFFMPVATGNASRLASIGLKNLKNMSFDEFVAYYREAIEKARCGEVPPFGSVEFFHMGHHLVNLPNLRFTHVKSQMAKHKSLHMWWTFGQRYELGNMMKVPMTLRMHHANGDPVVLDSLLKRFNLLCSKGTQD